MVVCGAGVGVVRRHRRNHGGAVVSPEHVYDYSPGAPRPCWVRRLWRRVLERVSGVEVFDDVA